MHAAHKCAETALFEREGHPQCRTRVKEQRMMVASTPTPGPIAFTTFGDFLQYLRRRQHLKQVDLAIATGYSVGQISRLEQNQRRPNPSTVQALFIPALDLDDEPQLAARLIELGVAAHDQPEMAIG